jgi:hypothetical protein
MIQTVQVLDPFKPNRVQGLFPTLGVTGVLPTFFVDIALLLRMVAVYPFHFTPNLQFFTIFIPPVLFKIARVCTLIVWEIYEPKDVLSQIAADYASIQRSMIIVGNVMIAADNA